MAYNTTSELRELYFQHSGYFVGKPANSSYDSLLQRPSNGYFERLKPDAALLKEALTLYISPKTSTVAEQVFGNQARQERIGLKHLVNILYERALLHKNHLKGIDHRLMQSQEKLSILKMHFPLDGGRSQQNLEKLIIELEKQRHDEEINFWKDSTEIRQKLFDGAIAYSATRHRKDMLYGVEGENA
jgi:hypothetical protein